MRKLYTIVLLLIFLVIFSLNFNFNFKEIKKIGDSPVYKAVFSKTEEQRASLPALVIIYDDGFIEDYSRAFYIHRKLDVPAVAAVNPECIGREGRLGLEHLQEMEAAGWEIASHGQFHAAFIYNQVIKTAARGATGLYVKHPELIEKRYRYVLFNSDSGVSETITIANIRRDGGQTYLKLEKPLAHDYPTSRTYIMLAKSALKHELLHSKAILEDCGFNVENFVYPYNGYIKPAVEMVKKYYQAARGGAAYGEKFPMAFINTVPFDRYHLKGVCFENDLLTDERLRILMEKTVAKNGLLIMYAHSKSPHFSAGRLKDIIRIASEKGITITTLSDVVN